MWKLDGMKLRIYGNCQLLITSEGPFPDFSTPSADRILEAVTRRVVAWLEIAGDEHATY